MQLQVHDVARAETMKTSFYVNYINGDPYSDLQ